ncbi:MAG: signal peptidase II [Clostridiales bacterium]|nr:signal peptidase II [Clostridiales bacterium]
MRWILGIALYFIDRGVKYWAQEVLQQIGKIEILPGFLSFQFVKNHGIAFGWFSDIGNLQIVFSLIAITVLGWIMKRYQLNKSACWGMVLIIAGAFGNVTDRLLYGYVIDMIQLDFISFPIFNIADIAVVIGTVVVMVAVLFSKTGFEKKKDENSG